MINKRVTFYLKPEDIEALRIYCDIKFMKKSNVVSMALTRLFESDEDLQNNKEYQNLKKQDNN